MQVTQNNNILHIYKSLRVLINSYLYPCLTVHSNSVWNVNQSSLFLKWSLLANYLYTGFITMI